MNRSYFVVLVMLIVLASSTYALVNETIGERIGIQKKGVRARKGGFGGFI